MTKSALDQAEFDKFAEEYLASHAENLKISGESPEYFAQHKIAELRRRWTQEGRTEPAAVLDFGCGIGASLPHLERAFPGAKITGLDVSDRSLAIARTQASDKVDLVLHDGSAEFPLPPESYDLVFSACVFHHIDHAAHESLLRNLRGLLRPGGILCIFEHNPLNPVTCYIVATCPFDENAVLIDSGRLKAKLRGTGFDPVGICYTGFFPGPLRFLRPLEGSLKHLPIGAQYYAWARA